MIARACACVCVRVCVCVCVCVCVYVRASKAAVFMAVKIQTAGFWVMTMYSPKEFAKIVDIPPKH